MDTDLPELFTEIVFDFETNGLLNAESIDYTASPYRLQPTYRVWCGTMRDLHQHMQYKTFIGEEMLEFISSYLPNVKKMVCHNGIDFDFLVFKLAYGIDYEIGETTTLNGKPVELIDTLVLSKVLNPDRIGGHSLEATW